MTGKIDKKSIIRYVVALLCVVVFGCVIFRKEEKTQQYDIVILGDSVVGSSWGGISVESVLEERLGKSVLNGAFGGSCMSVSTDLMWSSLSNAEWCMVKLAEAIRYDDWESQLATMQYADSFGDLNTQSLDYFGERMRCLSQVDFSQVEILVIEHGTNDYNSGKRVDNPEDLYDVTTFGGALRYSLRLLQEAYPELKIVLMSPIYCALGENSDLKCYNTSYGEGGILDEYVALEKQIAEEFGVEWIDAYHESGIWEDNAAIYMMDSLHPYMQGHELLGNFLAEKLEPMMD